ncbi:MAG: amidohydrolase family protein [Candidatus Heteroscillospira sp.]|jgi:5-methylthioadenosine/S-adenosylhomocysteine deaminase
MRTQIRDILAILPDGVRRCSIYIDGDTIVSVDDKPADFVPDKIIDGRSKLASPGFVNAHTHNYMTLMRSYADDLSFGDWLFGRIMPMEDRLTPEDAYWSCMLAAMEMIASGTTCYLDMHMFPDVTVRAALDSGMRAVISRGLSGGGDDAQGGARRIREARDEINAWRDKNPRLSFMLAPHAVYTCSEDYLREIAGLAGELGLGINTHLAETDTEVRTSYEKYGCSPVELYDRFGLLKSNTVAAHCVRLSVNDINILSYRGVSAAINTGSNLKLGNGTPPIASLKRHGVNLCFGTDSAASNNSLSVLREMQLFSLVHKGVTKDPTIAPAADCFDMATKNGAQALGLGEITGQLRAGMKADIAIFGLDEPGRVPLTDPKAVMCYASAGWNADTVLIDGVVVMENGEFTQFDAEKVKAEVFASCKRLGIEEKITANV